MTITPQIICDIIRRGLSLSADQIWVYNQRRSIPEDKRLYVVVGVISFVPMANNSIVECDANGATESLYQIMAETISINLFSYGTDAVERYPEILGALRSVYSQEKQALYALKIAEIPASINDVSEVEGATYLYRINITLPCWRKYSTIGNIDYYDTVTTKVYDEISGEVAEIIEQPVGD